jgi:FMN phosphatase YigB (HAD superfamily)
MLMVGDSINDDYHGALKAGAQALLVDRDGRAAGVPGIQRITNLKELLR